MDGDAVIRFESYDPWWHYALCSIVTLVSYLLLRWGLGWIRAEDPFRGDCAYSYSERLSFPYDCGDTKPCTVTTTVPVCAKWNKP